MPIKTRHSRRYYNNYITGIINCTCLATNPIVI
nr:MAG TPA: hypothetical protein [Caudoviricetes sp.]